MFLRALLVIVGSVLAAASSVAAGPMVVLAADGGAGGGGGGGGAAGVASLAPGEVVEVRWSEVPKGVEEMELLLSLDGGSHFTLRVTPDLDADHGSYRWRVPPFPSSRAQLAIRVNLGGREVIAGRSAAFRIASDRADRAGSADHTWSVHRRGGELWIGGLDDEGDDALDGAFGWAAGAPPSQLAPGLPAAASIVPPPPPRAVRPAGEVVPARGRDSGGALCAAARTGGRPRRPLLSLRI